MTQRVGIGIALLLHDRDTRRWVSGQRHDPAALYPQERLDTHFTGSWADPRAVLDRSGKSRPHGDSIPDLQARSSVTIPTELPGLHWAYRTFRMTPKIIRYDIPVCRIMSAQIIGRLKLSV